ncbi:MAG: substrate-binding domain-containing protein [Campylobacterota bacterium]|nr:substrate-binding domain-containing protein [Campylobacterota bacterium]
MKIRKLLIFVFVMLFTLQGIAGDTNTLKKEKKQLAYIVSDSRIPFWNIMSRGIKSKAQELGYEVQVYSANNLMKTELENTIKSIKSKVDGIIVSPISSSTAATILKLSSDANIPVVISDIGTDSGDYISYISSDNFQGAYELGKVLTKKIQEMQLKHASVGIVAIPQKRDNGKLRTSGFMKALNEAGIKSSGLRQQVDFSYKETYDHSLALIKGDSNLRALWLQGSNRYQGALDAIADVGKKGEILLVCFDAEPEFMELIPQGILVGAAMQQPFLMGEKAVEVMDKHLNNKSVEKNIHLPILAVSTQNIVKNKTIIKRNVLGVDKN